MLSPFDIPIDLDTPVSAFLKLTPLSPRFLLESVEGGERVGRYSILGLGDALDVQIDGGVLSIGDERRPAATSKAGLLSQLREALSRAPLLSAQGERVPFEGGLVGLTGYDVVRRFERLGEGPAGDRAPEAAYIAPRSALLFDHATRRAALLHAGPEQERLSLRREVLSALSGTLPPLRKGRSSRPSSPFSIEAFERGVDQVKEHIAAGDVFQLVLSRAFEGETDIDPFKVYRALRLLNPSPYMFFCKLGERALVGSSPEALVKLDGRRAELRPIAGTRPRGRDEAEDLRLERELLADPKEAAEHVMLVDLARNDLGRVAEPGSIEVSPYRSVERYSHVMHIVSGVKGRLAEGHDALDLFAATFPAGTVVGAPKVRAMQIIDEIEPTRRGFYAGTVGYFGHGGRMDQAIAIRTMCFGEGRYRFQAGAGVVEASTAAGEAAEVLAKGKALEAALTLAEEL